MLTDDIKDIRRMLYDFHPAEQVQTLLFKLIGKLNAVANYASMEMELECYRNGHSESVTACVLIQGPSKNVIFTQDKIER